MTDNIVIHGEHEYRRKDGQFLRRLAERETSWLVLDHGEEVPQGVKDQLAQAQSGLRFD